MQESGIVTRDYLTLDNQGELFTGNVIDALCYPVNILKKYCQDNQHHRSLIKNYELSRLS